MKSIVLGVDVRGGSLAAVDWAADRAARDRARVDIVMVAGSILSEDSRTDPSLVRAESRLHDRAPEVEVTSIRIMGRMPESLIERAREADVLVIGARRGRPVRAALTRWLPWQIASRSVVPVVVVPDGWTLDDGPVVIGVDDDDSSRAALVLAATEASITGTTLTVVHAWRMPTPQFEGSVVLLASPIQVKADHRTVLHAAIREVSASYPDLLVGRVLVHASPVTALLDVAEGASLLVVGTHHRGFVAAAVLGSVARDVLAVCPIPVCVAPLVPGGATRSPVYSAR